MRGTGDVSVAVDAGEHAAVDGIFEGLRIDVQADSLAVFIVGQRGVTVAGQAFIGGGFCWCFGRVFLPAARTVPAVKSRVRATPGAKILRIVRVDMLSPANLSELNFAGRPFQAAVVFGPTWPEYECRRPSP